MTTMSRSSPIEVLILLQLVTRPPIRKFIILTWRYSFVFNMPPFPIKILGTTRLSLAVKMKQLRVQCVQK